MTDISHIARLDGLELAYRFTEGEGPVIVFLPGYMSDMDGGKATAVFDWAKGQGRAALLLDYSGCGASEGDFRDGTLGVWLSDAMRVADHVAKDRPLLLIGSSMGGWLMLLIALARPRQVAGLVGIAAAPDFTDWGMSDADKETVRSEGVLYEDNAYGPDPTPTWKGFFEDAGNRLLLGSEIALDCPVRLLHGQADPDVPWQVSLTLAEKLSAGDVRTILIKDGDHRLSRDADIALLIETVANHPALAG